MRRLFSNHLRRLRAHPIYARTEGASALEFALIAPVMMLMLMGSVEFSLIMYAQSVLSNAVYNGSRMGKTGYATTGQTRLQSVVALVNQRAGGLFDTSKITITTQSYNQWSQISPGNPGSSDMGNSGQVVVYVFSYPWTIYTPIMQNFIGTNGVYTLTARLVVQNEPW